MEPVAEGVSAVASEIGAVANTAVNVEGGLGAAASAMGKLEGSLAPVPELGGIGDLKPQAEGLAKGLEATLGTPDIGIQKIAEVDISDSAQALTGSPETPERASEAATQAITRVESAIGPAGKLEVPEGNEPTGELKARTETEAQVPTQEIPKVPGKLAGDQEYMQIVAEHYHQAKQKGETIDKTKMAEITRQSLSEYYDNGAKNQVEKGLSDEIKEDPLYQQKLGEALTNAQDRGEPLDPNKLSQEALSKYQQEKDLQVEEAEGPKAEQMKTEESLEDVAKRLSDLLENNEAILESAKVTISAKDLALLLKALAEGKEPDQKKKESMLAILLRILMIMGLSTFEEAGKQAEQEVTRRR